MARKAVTSKGTSNPPSDPVPTQAPLGTGGTAKHNAENSNAPDELPPDTTSPWRPLILAGAAVLLAGAVMAALIWSERARLAERTARERLADAAQAALNDAKEPTETSAGANGRTPESHPTPLPPLKWSGKTPSSEPPPPASSADLLPDQPVVVGQPSGPTGGRSAPTEPVPSPASPSPASPSPASPSPASPSPASPSPAVADTPPPLPARLAAVDAPLPDPSLVPPPLPHRAPERKPAETPSDETTGERKPELPPGYSEGTTEADMPYVTGDTEPPPPEGMNLDDWQRMSELPPLPDDMWALNSFGIFTHKACPDRSTLVERVLANQLKTPMDNRVLETIRPWILGFDALVIEVAQPRDLNITSPYELAALTPGVTPDDARFMERVENVCITYLTLPRNFGWEGLRAMHAIVVDLLPELAPAMVYDHVQKRVFPPAMFERMRPPEIPGAIADWVYVHGFVNETQRHRLVTKGMARFALPDIEFRDMSRLDLGTMAAVMVGTALSMVQESRGAAVAQGPRLKRVRGVNLALIREAFAGDPPGLVPAPHINPATPAWISLEPGTIEPDDDTRMLVRIAGPLKRDGSRPRPTEWAARVTLELFGLGLNPDYEAEGTRHLRRRTPAPFAETATGSTETGAGAPTGLAPGGVPGPSADSGAPAHPPTLPSAPVLAVPSASDDAPKAMRKAMAEGHRRARAGLGNFLERCRAGLAQGGWRCGVKAPFGYRMPGTTSPATDSEGIPVEYMWVAVVAVGTDVIEGLLVNEPQEAKHLKLGQRVRVAIADVYDWLLETPDGQRAGQFTDIPVAGPQAPPPSAPSPRPPSPGVPPTAPRR